MWGYGVTCVGVGIDADAAPAWCVIEFDLTRAGLEAASWVFGIDAAFDGVVAGFGVDDVVAEFFTCCDLDLLFDEVASIDFFGDGVFDLDAGVHFHEVEVA